MNSNIEERLRSLADKMHDAFLISLDAEILHHSLMRKYPGRLRS